MTFSGFRVWVNLVMREVIDGGGQTSWWWQSTITDKLYNLFVHIEEFDS
jgi:hypothetical protein